LFLSIHQKRVAGQSISRKNYQIKEQILKGKIRIWLLVTTAAITVSDTILTERNVCILCCACIKIFPSSTRVWEDLWVSMVAEWLSTNYYHRKEPEI